MTETFFAVRCHEDGLSRQVTVRRLVATAPESRTQFIANAVRAAHFEHQNVTRVFDFGTVGETHYVEMEAVDGIPMQRYRGKEQAFLHLAVGAARGLAHIECECEACGDELADVFVTAHGTKVLGLTSTRKAAQRTMSRVLTPWRSRIAGRAFQVILARLRSFAYRSMHDVELALKQLASTVVSGSSEWAMPATVAYCVPSQVTVTRRRSRHAIETRAYAVLYGLWFAAALLSTAIIIVWIAAN